MANSEDMRKAPETYIEALNNKDLECIMSLYADDATVEDPVGTGIKQGKAAVREFYGAAVAADINAELSGEVRQAGLEVAFPFILKMAGMEMHIIDTFRFNEDGKVVEMRAFWGESNTHQG